MSVHYTDKISHLLAMDDMAGSSLLQSIRAWTNLIRQGCQDISLIWGAGNSLWQCRVLSRGFRAAECRCVEGSVFGFGCTYTKRPSKKVPWWRSANKSCAAIEGVVWWRPDWVHLSMYSPCVGSWNLTSIMSGEYLIRPFQGMKDCLHVWSGRKMQGI